MNFIDYAIGLGAGVLITLIIQFLKKSNHLKSEFERELHKAIERSKSNLIKIESLQEYRTLHFNSITDLQKRIEKLESKKR